LETPQLKLLRNPEVTVRSRGVMEKVHLFDVQRINNARIEAEKIETLRSTTALSSRRANKLADRGHRLRQRQ